MRRYLAPPLRLPQIYLDQIPNGYLGTARTVEHIKTLIQAGARDFYVRQKAIDILLERRVKPKDYRGEIKALFEWVQQNVRYTKDPVRVEMLHSPRRMLELRAGDCDDMTILLGAMLEAIGHPIQLVLAGPDPYRPLLFSHIYLEVDYKGQWIPLDPTMPYPMGWAPIGLVKKVIAMRANML
jgi:transglutaminase-like putative cysteine protease